MQQRLVPLTELPEKILIEIGSLQDDVSLAATARTCWFFHGIHKDELQNRRLLKDFINKLDIAAGALAIIEADQKRLEDDNVIIFTIKPAIYLAQYENLRYLIQCFIYTAKVYAFRGIKIDGECINKIEAIVNKYGVLFSPLTEEDFANINDQFEMERQIITNQNTEISHLNYKI